MIRVISILGSTGSIGVNVLDVVDRMPGAFEVKALAAGKNGSRLSEQIEKYHPSFVSVSDREQAAEIRTAARRSGTKVLCGPEAAEEIAALDGVDLVVSAITGMAGFRPTLAAIEKGKVLALANKESMVVGGALIRAAARRSGARIIPVDSEHSGVFQCLRRENRKRVRLVILTASGGPFFRTPLAELGRKTVDEALRHPRWRMGRKVTVDSATMINKGLELIEARWLFDIPPARLDVLIHPQSMVHSLVELEDGSVLAQLSATDMRLPIQYALTYPGRVDSSLPRLDLAEVGKLEFFPVELRRYPLFAAARKALEEGGSAPVAINAANETAVAAFLAGKIRFTGITDVVEDVMSKHGTVPVDSVATITAIDLEARRLAAERMEKITKG